MYFVCVVAYLKGSKSVVNVLLLQIAQAQSSVGERRTCLVYNAIASMLIPSNNPLLSAPVN